MYQQRVTMRMGPKLTRLTRNLLIALVALYMIQLVLENWLGLPVLAYVAWWGPSGSSGLGAMFKPWQPLSAFLINGPTPVAALVDWLVLFFFFPPAEEILGKKGTFSVLATSWFVAVLVSLPLLFLHVISAPAPYLGLNCFLTALVVVFGLSRPHARILLFFVIPIKAGWVAWGTGFIAVLYFLYERSLGSSIAFFGWCGAVVWMYADGSPGRLLRKLRMRWMMRRPQGRGDQRFDVIQGGRSSQDEDEGPWYH